MSAREIQTKLDQLLAQRRHLSAEIAGLYYQLRRLKKAGKTGVEVVQTTSLPLVNEDGTPTAEGQRRLNAAFKQT